jgi:hypothetical protein
MVSNNAKPIGVKKMQNLASKAVEVITGYKSNKVIMSFVTNEAREKVASEIRDEMKGGTTAKAVELLEMRNPNIKARVENYVNIGLIGVYFKSLEAA